MCCGVEWCGVVWSDVVWCGVEWCTAPYHEVLIGQLQHFDYLLNETRI